MSTEHRTLADAAQALGVTVNALRDTARRVGARLLPDPERRVSHLALDSDGYAACAAYLLGRRAYGVSAGALATACAAVAAGRSDLVAPLRFVRVTCGGRSEPWRLELIPTPEQAPQPAGTLAVRDLLVEAAEAAAGERS